MQGNLRLLEINPRFTLWHHAGALAGVNIPALVYADLTGSPRPAPSRLKVGLRWCRPEEDFQAAREAVGPLFAFPDCATSPWRTDRLPRRLFDRPASAPSDSSYPARYRGSPRR